MKEIAKQYFDAWNENSVEKLRPLFHKAVTLTDWEISESGIENVLEANQKIFDDVPGISVTVDNMDAHNNMVMAEITVNAESFEQPLAVLDVFTFSDDKITSIKAYKK